MMSIVKNESDHYSSTSSFPNDKSYFSATSDTNSQTGAFDVTITGMVRDCIVQVNDLQKEVNQLQKEQRKTSEYYKENAKLAKTSRILMIILMVIPGIQLIACTAVVYYLGIENQLTAFLRWIIGSVSILSISEKVFTAFKYFSLENKVDELKKAVEKQPKEKE